MLNVFLIKKLTSNEIKKLLKNILKNFGILFFKVGLFMASKIDLRHILYTEQRL